MVYLDTNCVIYLVERNPTWLAKVVSRLTHFRAAGDRLVVGDLTRAECLVGPFLTGDAVVEASYRAHGLTEVRWHPLTFGIATLYVGTKKQITENLETDTK
jgi:hypothetical protein